MDFLKSCTSMWRTLSNCLLFPQPHIHLNLPVMWFFFSLPFLSFQLSSVPPSRLRSQSASFTSFALQHIVSLVFSSLLSCSLCLSFYFAQSFICLPLSIPPSCSPFFHLSFSGSLSSEPPSSHALSHPIDGWCGAASRASIREAGVLYGEQSQSQFHW